MAVTKLLGVFAFDEEETFNTCPACGRRDALHNCDQTPDERAERIWQQACQNDAMVVKANETRRLVSLLVLLFVLVVLAVIMFAAIWAQ